MVIVAAHLLTGLQAKIKAENQNCKEGSRIMGTPISSAIQLSSEIASGRICSQEKFSPEAMMNMTVSRLIAKFMVFSYHYITISQWISLRCLIPVVVRSEEDLQQEQLLARRITISAVQRWTKLEWRCLPRQAAKSFIKMLNKDKMFIIFCFSLFIFQNKQKWLILFIL